MQTALRAYADYIRMNATCGRHVEHVGPFIATVSEHTANPYLSDAIPVDGAAPPTTTCERSSACSGVEAACHGWSTSRCSRPKSRRGWTPPASHRAPHPLLVCTPPELRPVPVPDGVAVRPPAGDGEDLAAAGAQHDAYQELGPAGPDDAARLRRLAEGGGVVVVALVEATGEAAGAGVCDAIHRGVGELAGIGVRAWFRRRGIAAVITHRLARAAFAAGAATVFLTPAARPSSASTSGSGSPQPPSRPTSRCGQRSEDNARWRALAAC